MNVKELLHKALSIILPIGMMMGSLCLTSCEESSGLDEYANWKERNIAYIHDIARMAEENVDGKWLKLLAFNLDSVDAAGRPVEHGVEDFVYCHVEESGEGAVHPLYTDIVSVNYRGRLIPTETSPYGEVFDESYKGAFNPEFNVPQNFRVDELIVGWSTALMQMTKGDSWRIYIPAGLGYGAEQEGDIPAYSTLIFDLNLVDF